MSQIVIAEIVLLVGAAALVRWIWVYSRLQPWWRDPETKAIGWSLVAKDGLLAIVLLCDALIEFWHVDPTDRRVLFWIEIVLVAMIAPVMEWRTWIWKRASRRREHQ